MEPGLRMYLSFQGHKNVNQKGKGQNYRMERWPLSSNPEAYIYISYHTVRFIMNPLIVFVIIFPMTEMQRESKVHSQLHYNWQLLALTLCPTHSSSSFLFPSCSPWWSWLWVYLQVLLGSIILLSRGRVPVTSSSHTQSSTRHRWG